MCVNYIIMCFIGLHPDYLKKQSLVQFQDFPPSYQTVSHTMMYLYCDYSHKVSWQTVNKVPFIIVSYKHTECSRNGRKLKLLELPTSSWNTPYFGLDDIDALHCSTGSSGYCKKNNNNTIVAICL